MKILSIKFKKMPVAITVILLATWFGQSIAFGQKSNKTSKYLEALPVDLKLKETSPQKYLMTAVYYNKDIYGNFFNKTLVSGEYTRGLVGGYVKWNDVKISESNNLTGMFPEGQKQDYMEDFQYKPSEDMVKESAFEKFPVNNIYSFHTKNLVWDVLGIEVFAWVYFDSLKLNQVYAPSELSGSVPLAGAGYFNNRNIELTWTGISKMNGELCAIIQCSAMDNTLEINSGDNAISFSAKGRSHYWGNVWVSLEDKQIEHAVLYEDVIMDMQFSESNNQIINATRELKLEKLN